MQRLQWKQNGKIGKDTSMAADESQKWKRSDRWSKEKGRKVQFASLMDLCHLKNSELEPQFQKYKGRVVLPGDIVKDDSGSYAVFTEQGSSASQMTAAQVMDILSRLPGCAGQAVDAVSAYTQVKMEKQESTVRMSRYLDTSTKAQMAKIMAQHGRTGCSSRAESVRSSFGRTIMGKAIRERCIKNAVGKKFRIGNVYSLTERKDYSCVCMWTISNWLGKKQNVHPT